MIRRDYILRMIQEFIQALSRIRSLKREQRWNEAGDATEAEFQRLLGSGAAEIARLSDTELLARLVQGESTLIVRQKALALAALLQESGDVAAGQERTDESRSYYLKALHLLLNTLAAEDLAELPEFAPRVESLVESLQEAPLPVPTQAMLMRHYEQAGEFARAEDALGAILDADPANRNAVEFGLMFYRRLQSQSDTALLAGNLPRVEVEQGMRELESRLK